MRKAIVVAIVLSIPAALLGGCGGRSANTPSAAAAQKKTPLVEVAVAQRGDIARVLQTTGTVASANEIQVSSKVEQRITWLTVREGDRVTKGQVLARLDMTELDAQTRQAQAEVRVAQARLRDAEAGSRIQEIRGAEAAVRQAEAQLASARSAAEDARRDVERQRQLLAIGGASQQEVDHAQTKSEAAQSQVEATQAALAAARERLGLLREGAAQTQLALAREQVAQAKDKLAYWQAQAQFYVIRSPLSGVVIRVDQHAGDLASPKAPVLAIADTSQTIVRTSVTDTEAARLRLGQPVKAEVDALPEKEPLSLHITRIYPATDVSSRLVTVEKAVPVPAKQESFKPKQPDEDRRPFAAVSVAWTPTYDPEDVSYGYSETDPDTGKVFRTFMSRKGNSIVIRLESGPEEDQPQIKGETNNETVPNA